MPAAVIRRNKQNDEIIISVHQLESEAIRALITYIGNPEYAYNIYVISSETWDKITKISFDEGAFRK